MNPDDIKLEKLSKEFQYHRVAKDIDSIDDIDNLKIVAKTWVKLYLKQQEVLSNIEAM